MKIFNVIMVLLILLFALMFVFNVCESVEHERIGTVVGKGTMQTGSTIEYFYSVIQRNGDKILLMNVNDTKYNKCDDTRIDSYIELDQEYKFKMRYNNIISCQIIDKE